MCLKIMLMRRSITRLSEKTKVSAILSSTNLLYPYLQGSLCQFLAIDPRVLMLQMPGVFYKLK